MKKIVAVFATLLVSLMLFSCATPETARVSGILEGEVTQARVDEALSHIYELFRPRLDLTGAQEHVVVAGDTLSGIARNFFGHLTNVGDAGFQNGFYFPVIMMASQTHIVDPDLIEPGLSLTIIDLRRNLDNPIARAAIRESLLEVAYVYGRRGRSSEEDGLRRLANSL